MDIKGHRGKQAGHDLSRLPPARNSLEWFNGICEKQLRKGDNIILAAFGGGFTWGSVFLKWAYDTN